MLVQRLHAAAVIPRRQTSQAAGLDLVSVGEVKVVLALQVQARIEVAGEGELQSSLGMSSTQKSS